jgi:sugar/nucleoside kinase (ribokinase family)
MGMHFLDFAIVGQLFVDLFVVGAQIPKKGRRGVAQAYRICPGGVVYTASALSRLGFSVGIYSPMADDWLAQFIHKQIDSLKSVTLRASRHPSGQSPITISLSQGSGNERKISYIDSELLEHPIPFAETSVDTGHVHFGSIAEAVSNYSWIETLAASGVEISMDYQFNPRFRMTDCIRDLLNLGGLDQGDPVTMWSRPGYAKSRPGYGLTPAEGMRQRVVATRLR